MIKLYSKAITQINISLPTGPEAFIPQNHLVRAVDKIIDKIDISAIIENTRELISFYNQFIIVIIVIKYMLNKTERLAFSTPTPTLDKEPIQLQYLIALQYVLSSRNTKLLTSSLFSQNILFFIFSI
jgi:hypothetical protein